MGLTRPRAYQIYDLDYKQAVRVVTTSNITLSGGAPNSVDGVTLTLKDRVLVTGQSTGSQNGIYYVSTLGTGSNGTWSRSIDTDATGELLSGTIVMVTEGTTYADTQWKLTTNDPITIGSTSLTFIQNYSTNSISAGTSNVVVTSGANVTISSAGTPNVLIVTSTGANIAGTATASILKSIQSSGDEGGELQLALAATNTTLNGNVTVDVYQNKFRIFESGGTARGAYIDLTQAAAGAGTNLLAGGGGGTPGGSNTQVQFNDSGLFGATAGFTFNKTTNAVATTGTLSATGNIAGGNVSGTRGAFTNIAGTLETASQTNITSVGTLGSLSVTGNITGGNILGGANVNATTHTGTTVNVSGNITGGNLLTGGLISASGTITGSSFSGAGTGLTGTASSLTVGTATIAGTVTTAAQPNITSTGTLSSLNVTGNITSSTGYVGTIYTNSIINTGANGTGNIGSSSLYFNTAFVKATSAQYADLAEMYVADDNYSAGTVVEFGGDKEITITTHSHSTAVAGIISTNPSYLMNSTQTGEHVLPVALTGRVPCQVLGPVNKGDVLVASHIPGVAQRIGINWQPGCVLGKAMEKIISNEVKTIEVAVGRL